MPVAPEARTLGVVKTGTNAVTPPSSRSTRNLRKKLPGAGQDPRGAPPCFTPASSLPSPWPNRSVCLVRAAPTPARIAAELSPRRSHLPREAWVAELLKRHARHVRAAGHCTVCNVDTFACVRHKCPVQPGDG